VWLLQPILNSSRKANNPQTIVSTQKWNYQGLQCGADRHDGSPVCPRQMPSTPEVFSTRKRTIRHDLRSVHHMTPLPASQQPARSLEILILSKDRAAQLDSLLRSMRDHFHIPHGAVHLLYKASSEPFERGYDLLKRHGILPDTHWHAEQDFRADILALLGALPRTSLVMILVDDDIVFRDFSDRGLTYFVPLTFEPSPGARA